MPTPQDRPAGPGEGPYERDRCDCRRLHGLVRAARGLRRLLRHAADHGHRRAGVGLAARSRPSARSRTSTTIAVAPSTTATRAAGPISWPAAGRSNDCPGSSHLERRQQPPMAASGVRGGGRRRGAASMERAGQPARGSRGTHTGRARNASSHARRGALRLRGRCVGPAPPGCRTACARLASISRLSEWRGCTRHAARRRSATIESGAGHARLQSPIRVRCGLASRLSLRLAGPVAAT